MVFNDTFTNVSVISWHLVLLVEKTGVPGENHWPAASHWQTSSVNVVSSWPTHHLDSERIHTALFKSMALWSLFKGNLR